MGSVAEAASGNLWRIYAEKLILAQMWPIEVCDAKNRRAAKRILFSEKVWVKPSEPRKVYVNACVLSGLPLQQVFQTNVVDFLVALATIPNVYIIC